MKRITLIALALVLGLPVMAQRRKAIASFDQMTQQHTLEDRVHQVMYSAEPTLVHSHPITSETSLVRTGGVNTVSPVELGRASNIFSILRTEQNQVYADDNLGIVAFIHRQDVTIWGGGTAENGKLRFDISVDGGTTFSPDVDVLNATYTRPARYPNITGFNPNNETNPFNTFLAYSAPTLNPSWDGHVTGMADVTTSAPSNATETYSLLSSETLLQGGLTEGRANEFWTVEAQYDNSTDPGTVLGDIYVNKGMYYDTTSPPDIVWSRYDTISPNHIIRSDGSVSLFGPNIAFSPDGETGWIAWLGDLDTGGDSVYSPIFIKSTDGGTTWGSPIEVDLNANPDVAEWLTSFWSQVDSATGDTFPISTGRATCLIDYDITVDANGNPHMAVVIGSGAVVGTPDPYYGIYDGIEKFMADVTTDDGGATWYVNYVAPVLAFRGEFGNTGPVGMDNFPQISRTPSGDHVFYSWVDSDTSQTTGSMNGIGFGESDQLAPNLRIAGRRISDGYMTCYKRITDGDFLWDGTALFPTMAPEVIIDNGMVELPIVMVNMITNEPLESCIFSYFGNDATIDPATEFYPKSQLILEWDAPSCVDTTITNVASIVSNEVVLGQSFPNPTNGNALIKFELPFSANISLDLTNIYGQQIAVIADGDYPSGRHEIVVDTRELATGTYFYNLHANGKVTTKKMVVTK